MVIESIVRRRKICAHKHLKKLTELTSIKLRLEGNLEITGSIHQTQLSSRNGVQEPAPPHTKPTSHPITAQSMSS
jgi:hypothetical protein